MAVELTYRKFPKIYRLEQEEADTPKPKMNCV